VPADAPQFIVESLGPIIANEGDELPVSKMPVDGTFPLSLIHISEPTRPY
jgi:pyruvate-ferredoxin/flavodoxin oxidoreductase